MEIETIAAKYQLFAQMLLSDNVNTGSELFQALFFHYAVFSTVKRSLETNQGCNCTPHPGYFVSKIPFFCQEDYLMDTKRFISILEDPKYTLKGKEVDLYNYLKLNSNEAKIPSIRLLSIMQSTADFIKRVEKKIALNSQKVNLSTTINDDGEISTLCDPLPGEGSGLGCCGNYDGCCWYWSVFCLTHDIDCLCCDHWYCLWGCKKESWCPKK